MVLFNYSTKELTAKVVYYGPGLCGKTTNLQWIHEKLPIKNKGKMLSLATETDRTLFFDFLPIELGTIRGMKTRVQLYTVPGQVFYNATRRMVLKGADGVVFVADSQDAMLDANAESLENLRENLEVNEISLDDIPLVLQYNKRDLPNAASIADLNARLNPRGLPYYEAVAVNGVGVEETLKGVTSVVFKSLASRYGGPAGAAAAAKTEVPQPNVVSTQPVTPQAPHFSPPPPPARVQVDRQAAEEDMFSPEDLLEVVEEESAPEPLPELALDSAAEPIEELTLDDLGAEFLVDEQSLEVIDVDSFGPPMTARGTVETVDDFSPLAELEGILEGDGPAAFGFGSEQDALADLSSEALDVGPDEYVIDESTATAPAQPLPPAAPDSSGDTFSPGSLLDDSSAVPEQSPDAGFAPDSLLEDAMPEVTGRTPSVTPDALLDATPQGPREFDPLFGLGAGALPESTPFFDPSDTAPAGPQLSIEDLDEAPEAPEVVERDAFSPGSLLGETSETTPQQTGLDSSVDSDPPQIDLSAVEPTFEVDALTESWPASEPFEPELGDEPGGEGPSSDPQLELDALTDDLASSEPALDWDESTGEFPASQPGLDTASASDEFDPLELAAESPPEQEREPEPQVELDFGFPDETHESFSVSSPDLAREPEPEQDPFAMLSPESATLPVAGSAAPESQPATEVLETYGSEAALDIDGLGDLGAVTRSEPETPQFQPHAESPLELESVSVEPSPSSAPELPEPASTSVVVPEPMSVPAGPVAGPASTQPIAPHATGVLVASPSAHVQEASLAVVGQAGDNEITIPVEVSLGPGGATSLNLNIRLVLNFKMK
jgi:hypothetical protein